MLAPRTPGVYREEVVLRPSVPLRTGVPVFLARGGGPEVPVGEPLAFAHRAELEAWLGGAWTGSGPGGGPRSYLVPAVRGFFANGGRECRIVRLADAASPAATWNALQAGLEAIEDLDSIDLVCAPDLMPFERPAAYTMAELDALRQRLQPLQAAILDHCRRAGDRFAILDGLPGAGTDAALRQRQGLDGANGALYHPWIRPESPSGIPGLLPPCGHVAGIYARCDEREGVHKAPANEELVGVLDLESAVDDEGQARLNPAGINCLRAFPGRGIRVWGARTLADPQSESAWLYVSVRRLFLTAARGLERALSDATFEPNDLRLWVRIQRRLDAYFRDLYRRGALHGDTPEAAFHVRCDAETNPPEVRERGEVVAEIALAASGPGEFVVVRMTHGEGGTALEGPLPSSPI